MYSETDTEEDVFVPCDVQVDGRKREAKQLKKRTSVPEMELKLQQMIVEF